MDWGWSPGDTSGTYHILGSVLESHKLGMMIVCDRSPSAQEAEVGGPGDQGHPWLSNEFVASLCYVRLCCETNNRNNSNNKPLML